MHPGGGIADWCEQAELWSSASGGDSPLASQSRHTTTTRRLPVNDGLLEISLNPLEHGPIGNGTECPDSRGAVEILLAGHVLHETAGDNDDIIGNVSHLLDGEVDHSAKLNIATLEKLRR